ncbi:MAG: methyl-accepting chemotaxis protein [Clostridium sp.]
MLNKIKKSIGMKLILMLIAVIIVSVSIMGSVIYKSIEGMFISDLKANSTEITGKLEDNLNSFFKTNEDTINMLTSNITITDAMYWKESIDLQFLDNALLNVKEAYPDIISVYVAKPDNSLVIYPHITIPKDIILKDRIWYKGAVEKQGIYWTQPYTDLNTKETLITVSSPIKTSRGEFGGVVAFDISLKSLQSLILKVKLGESGEFTLIDKDNIAIAHRNSEVIGKKADLFGLENVINKAVSGSEDYERNGDKRIAIFDKIEKTDWKIISTVSYNEINSKASVVIGITMICCIVIVLVGIVLVYFATKGITRSISSIKDDLEQVGNGNLNRVSNIKSRDELGELSGSFNEAIENLRSFMISVKGVAGEVTSVSTTIAATSQETNACIEEISKTVSEVASTTYEETRNIEEGIEKGEELSKALDNISKAIESSRESFNRADELNQSGTSKINTLIDKTKSNNTAFKEVQNIIKEVDVATSKIGDIVTAIGAIASQTNLLALNAAIEAARTGESGRGFAVVADEVRKLASESESATGEIARLISDIQKQSKSAVESVKVSIDASQAQDMAVRETEDIFNNINNNIREIYTGIEEIVSLNEEILTAREGITRAMNSITNSSSETNRASQEIANLTNSQLEAFDKVSEIATNLSILVDELNSELNQFSV